MEADIEKALRRKRRESEDISTDACDALRAQMNADSTSSSASSSQSRSLSSQLTNITLPSEDSQSKHHKGVVTTEDDHLNSIRYHMPASPKQHRKMHQNAIEKVDREVASLLDTLDEFERRNRNNQSISFDDKQFSGIIQRIKQVVLRLNLAKNLVQCELRDGKEESQIERRLFLKNITNFERNLELMKRENQAINEKNLKLIRYCRKLKNEKVKKLRAQNSKLKRRLRRELQVRAERALPEKSRHLKVPGSEQPDATVASRQNSSASMLDTLGRLASHVLQDEEFMKVAATDPSQLHSFRE